MGAVVVHALRSDYGDTRLPDRFWAKVQVIADASAYPGPCWIWTASLTEGGYANWTHRLGRVGHKVAYRALVGEYPAHLQLDHLCRVRSCVNPDHLEPVTPKENRARGRNFCAEKTHCPVGHPYDEENTIVVRRVGKPAGRGCRTCNNVRRRKPGAAKMQDRTHCPSGHLYSPENTFVRKDGSRFCRTCHNKQQRLKRAMETPEQREQRLSYHREYGRRRRAAKKRGV